MASLLTCSTLCLPKQIILSKSPSSQSKLFLRPPKPQSNPNLRLSASSLPLISDSTRSIASILATGLSIPKLLAQAIHGASSKIQDLCATPPQQDLAAIQQLQQSLAFSTAPLLFFTNRGSLSTPLTVVASGMAKWLDIYSGVLLVRVLLSWFPNIPWDRQPLSAIRDLCDPYLNLFRNIIPPLFDTLDVSPLLAFAVLGTFSGILTHSRT